MVEGLIYPPVVGVEENSSSEVSKDGSFSFRSSFLCRRLLGVPFRLRNVLKVLVIKGLIGFLID